MTAAKEIVVRSFAYHERLPSAKLGWAETGGHTNLDHSRKGCVYVKVGMIEAVTERVYVSNRQVD